MATPDVTLITPFPALGERHGGWTGVASYSANLAGALGDAGARVTVLAGEEPGEPAVARDGTLEVRRVWRRGPGALPTAAAAALATGAPTVHLQHELFLYGGPAAVPGVVPALAALRNRRAVVTMHHVVDPRAVDAAFTATHRVRAPAPLARVGVAAVQRTIGTLADTVVVHEPSFAAVVPGAEVVPHGIEVARAQRPRRRSRRARGRERPPVRALLRLPLPVQGARGGARRRPARRRRRRARDRRRRASAPEGHGRRLRRALRASAPPNARFTGFVPEADVARWFAAADVALLPYPQPFASSGPLALALAHDTPVLLSEALAGTMGAPQELAVAADPQSDRRPPAHARGRRRRARPAACRRRNARDRPHAGRRSPAATSTSTGVRHDGPRPATHEAAGAATHRPRVPGRCVRAGQPGRRGTARRLRPRAARPQPGRRVVRPGGDRRRARHRRRRP